MKEKEGIIITGNFLSASEKSDKLRCLVKMEICVAKINDPSSYFLGPKSSSFAEVILYWVATAAILYNVFDLLISSKDAGGGIFSPSYLIYVIIFTLITVLVAASYYYIKYEPKTYTDKLINTLTKYKPLDTDTYNLIMNKLNESSTLDLSEIKTFIDNERKAIKEFRLL